MLLPEPDGPKTRDQLARLDPQVETAQGDRLGRAGAEDLEDVVELERAEASSLAALRLAVEAPHLHRKLSIISR